MADPAKRKQDKAPDAPSASSSTPTAPAGEQDISNQIASSWDEVLKAMQSAEEAVSMAVHGVAKVQIKQ